MDPRTLTTLYSLIPGAPGAQNVHKMWTPGYWNNMINGFLNTNPGTATATPKGLSTPQPAPIRPNAVKPFYPNNSSTRGIPPVPMPEMKPGGGPPPVKMPEMTSNSIPPAPMPDMTPKSSIPSVQTPGVSRVTQDDINKWNQQYTSRNIGDSVTTPFNRNPLVEHWRLLQKYRKSHPENSAGTPTQSKPNTASNVSGVQGATSAKPYNGNWTSPSYNTLGMRGAFTERMRQEWIDKERNMPPVNHDAVKRDWAEGEKKPFDMEEGYRRWIEGERNLF